MTTTPRMLGGERGVERMNNLTNPTHNFRAVYFPDGFRLSRKHRLQAIETSSRRGSARMILEKIAGWPHCSLGWCWVTVNTLVSKTGYSRPTIFRHIATLEAEGIVEVRHAKGRVPNWYRIDYDRLDGGPTQPSQSETVEPSHGKTVEPCHSSASTVSSGAFNGLTATPDPNDTEAIPPPPHGAEGGGGSGLILPNGKREQPLSPAQRTIVDRLRKEGVGHLKAVALADQTTVEEIELGLNSLREGKGVKDKAALLVYMIEKGELRDSLNYRNEQYVRNQRKKRYGELLGPAGEKAWKQSMFERKSPWATSIARLRTFWPTLDDLVESGAVPDALLLADPPNYIEMFKALGRALKSQFSNGASGNLGDLLGNARGEEGHP
jgi:hypothetical protein